MKDRFIKFRVYQGLTQSECLLISLIISLNETGNSICFSNEYATFVLGTSLSSVKRDLKKLKTLGYISTTSSNQTRKIKVIQTPKFLDYPIEECEITEAHIEPASDPSWSIVSQQAAHIEPAAGSYWATYKIEDKKEDNIVEGRAVAAPTYPSDFLSFLELYGDTDPYISKAHETWNGLNDLEKKHAVDSIEPYGLYESRKNSTKKAVHYYLIDKPWTWSSVKRFITKKPKPILSNEEKMRIFENENPSFTETFKKTKLK